jgi:hypothetical protein
MKEISINQIKKDIERLEQDMEYESLKEKNLDSRFDKMIDREDLPGVEGTKETSNQNQLI